MKISKGSKWNEKSTGEEITVLGAHSKYVGYETAEMFSRVLPRETFLDRFVPAAEHMPPVTKIDCTLAQRDRENEMKALDALINDTTPPQHLTVHQLEQGIATLMAAKATHSDRFRALYEERSRRRRVVALMNKTNFFEV